MAKPVNLTEHRNTIEKRRRRAMRDDMIAACRSMAGDRDIRAFAIVAIDASGEACTQWDTGGIIPMWAFPGTVQRVLDFDLAQSGGRRLQGPSDQAKTQTRMTLCTISRAISRATGGRPGEMLCSRAYRNGWLRFVAIADAAAFALWGERDHCRNCYKREAGHG